MPYSENSLGAKADLNHTYELVIAVKRNLVIWNHFLCYSIFEIRSSLSCLWWSTAYPNLTTFGDSLMEILNVQFGPYLILFPTPLYHAVTHSAHWRASLIVQLRATICYSFQTSFKTILPVLRKSSSPVSKSYRFISGSILLPLYFYSTDSINRNFSLYYWIYVFSAQVICITCYEATHWTLLVWYASFIRRVCLHCYLRLSRRSTQPQLQISRRGTYKMAPTLVRRQSTSLFCTVVIRYPKDRLPKVSSHIKHLSYVSSLWETRILHTMLTCNN